MQAKLVRVPICDAVGLILGEETTLLLPGAISHHTDVAIGLDKNGNPEVRSELWMRVWTRPSELSAYATDIEIDFPDAAALIDWAVIERTAIGNILKTIASEHERAVCGNESVPQSAN